METKLHQKTEMKTKMPAGLFLGLECFWHNNEKWLLHSGRVMRFVDSPVKIQNQIAMAFLKDKPAREYLTQIGCTAFSKAFDRWYKCRLGALDGTPDFVNGQFHPDFFNNSCKDYNCVHRGKLCSTGANLKNYEVESLVVLREGNTINEAAEKLNVSHAGMKSRIEIMKEKLGAHNLQHLTAIAAEMGI